MHVLIVEDEMLIAETIKLYLAERGHTTSSIAISFDEAIASVKNPSIELVLIDVRLYGEKSGIDVAKHIAINYNLPFVYLTSQFDKRIIENAQSTNPQGYLTKPIQKETLWTTIEIALDNFTKQQEKESASEGKIIKINEGSQSYMIPEDSIIFINAEHVYINIHTKDKVYILRRSLSEIILELTDSKFIQCHRSYVINKEKVTGYDAGFIFIQNEKIPISRSRRKEVLEVFQTK